jgi:hypothetical protein
VVSYDNVRPRGGWAPAVSADASALVFTSDSASLTPEDTNNASDLFMPIDDRDPHCSSSSDGQVQCDITAAGEPAPRTIKWYFDDTYEPSLDNMTSVHLVVVSCQSSPLRQPVQRVCASAACCAAGRRCVSRGTGHLQDRLAAVETPLAAKEEVVDRYLTEYENNKIDRETAARRIEKVTAEKLTRLPKLPALNSD